MKLTAQGGIKGCTKLNIRSLQRLICDIINTLAGDAINQIGVGDNPGT